MPRPTARLPRLRRAVAALGTALLAAGCAATATQDRYDRTLAAYEAAGMMRTDPAPADAPFGNADLIRNFERIAFNMEFAPGDALVARSTPVDLVKWRSPVRWKLTGDGAAPRDRNSYRRLFARLHGLTGLEFQEVEDQPDLFILIAGPGLRRAFVEQLRLAGAGSKIRILEEWAGNDLYPCVGQVGRSRERGGWKNKATIVIKAETAGLLRESCIHEELTQTLGLLNDDAGARPSIFNDDQEFALLTAHDELLLRILYDPRLRAGMNAEEGMPIVRRIVEEIGPGARFGASAELRPVRP